MDEKKALALRIAAVEKQLAKQRINWFLGIWLGYSAVIFMFFYTGAGIDNILKFIFTDTIAFLELLIIPLIMGLFCWFINMGIWTACCNSIRDTVSVYERLVKEYNNMP